MEKNISYLLGCIVLSIFKAAAKAWGLLLVERPQFSCLHSACCLAKPYKEVNNTTAASPPLSAFFVLSPCTFPGDWLQVPGGT